MLYRFYCTSKGVTITYTHIKERLLKRTVILCNCLPFQIGQKGAIRGWSEFFPLLTVRYGMSNNISKLGDFPECVHYGCASLHKRSYTHGYTNKFGVLRVL